MGVISNCEITKQDSEILKECVMSSDNKLYSEYKGYHTGIDLSATKVYSLFDGLVVWIGNVTKGHSVIIRTGESFCMSYMYILSLPSNIQKGRAVSKGQYLGDVYKYVHVEKLGQTKSKWPVRLGVETWYKEDPTSMLYGGYNTTATQHKFSDMKIGLTSTYPSGDPNLNVQSEESLYILSNNE